MFTFILTLACSNNKDVDTAETTSTFHPTMPISECGLPSYDFLPTEDMGTLLSSDERNDLTLSKEALTALLTNFDLPLPPPTNGIQTYYVEYQSQDKGEPTNGTGMILFPEGQTEAPVILWLHPTMGFNDDCAPTAMGVIGAAYPAVFASLGFIVVAPDYLGMRGWTGESEDLHAYVGAEPTAILSIDSLRALPNLIQAYNKDISFDPKRIILWGASEGGFASLVTDRYLPHYAPEFGSLATIAATPVTDISALAERAVTEISPTSAGMIGVNVTLNQWYEANTDLSTMLQPEFLNVEDILYSSCDDFGSISEVESVEELFTQNFIDGVLANDGSIAPWDCFATDNDIKTKVPYITTAPTLIVTAEEDDLAWPTPVHNDIPVLCEQGYQIEHIQCAGAGHVSGILDSLRYQFDWIQARLNNEPFTPTCAVNTPSQCEE